MIRSDGKVALITGASGGIGRACAQQLAAEGVRLVLVDLDRDRLEEVAADLPVEKLLIAADVSDAAQAAGYVHAALDRFGRIDTALLNAGIEGRIASIEATELADYEKVMAVNVRGVWLALARLLPGMREPGGGSIVITSSITGLRGTAGQGAYVASKHAVLGLMKVAALEGAPHGIRVNAVCPGPTETRMMSSIETGFDALRPDQAKARIVAGVAQKRYGRPAEIASVICFLASEAASFCTGSIFSVDGGSMAGPVR
jgi:NAD(P)-dependent dehydrogenase (short-subunit alcohol dehydrogenase family)